MFARHAVAHRPGFGRVHQPFGTTSSRCGRGYWASTRTLTRHTTSLSASPLRSPTLQHKEGSNCITQRGLKRRDIRCAAQGIDSSEGAIDVPVHRSPVDILIGWIKWLLLIVVTIPIYLFQLATLLLASTLGAKQFFKRKDRSQHRFKDPPGLQHDMLDVNGLRLHCVTSGSGRGRPLMLFLHGFPELWYSWRHQLAEFQDDYEVAAIDMRGYGDSDKPQDQSEYMIDQLVSDVVGVIKALGHERATLVSHDWGANVAWFTAALHPEAVERMIVVGLPHVLAWGDNLGAKQLARSWYMAAFYFPFVAEAMLPAQDLQIFDVVFAKAKPDSEVGMRHKALEPEEIDRYKQKWGQKGAFSGPVNYYRNWLTCLTRSPTDTFNRGVRSLKAGLHMPTLMLYASHDAYLGKELLKGTDKYVTDLTVHIIDGSHFLQQDQPEEVNQKMREWLRAARPAGVAA